MIGRMAWVYSDSDQGCLLWIDFECLGLLLLVDGVVPSLRIVSAVRHRISFCHVVVVLAAMLVGAEVWRWLGNQVLLH